MDSDQVDGQRQRTRSIRSKFVIPLCCFAAGSELTAELNINTSDTQTESNTASKNTDAEAQDTNTQVKPETKPETKQESKPTTNG